MSANGLGRQDGLEAPAQRARQPAAAPCLQVTTQPGCAGPPVTWEAELHARTTVLSGSARQSAFALQMDAEAIVAAWGLNQTVFCTLTFGGGGEGPTVARAQACFNSYLSHELGDIFPGGIKVLERGAKHGRIHFHLLADAGEDVRTGVDFAALASGDRQSFGPRLRALHTKLKTSVKRYGFGRICECDPIKSTTEGVASYVCKYIWMQSTSKSQGGRWGASQ